MADEYPYIVAGAKMVCDQGSHFRRLDLWMMVRGWADCGEEFCRAV